jgi:hypothetical protein
MLLAIQFLLAMLATALAFAPMGTHMATKTTTRTTTASSLQMMSDLAALSSSGMLLADTEPWVQPLSLVLDPTLNLLSFAMVRLTVLLACFAHDCFCCCLPYSLTHTLTHTRSLYRSLFLL